MLQIRANKAARKLAIVLTTALAIGLPAAWHSAEADALAGAPLQLAQYYPYGPPPPGYYGGGGYYGGPPPCRAVNNPWGGAARGALGGAIIGGIAGDAGKGAAIGAGVGFLGRSIRNSNARANGYCY
jgi:hypothetical protein